MKTTVSDLIAFLQKQPADMRVVLNGYEGGLCDVYLSHEGVEQVPVELNVHDEFWYGPHNINKSKYDEIALVLHSVR